MKGNPLIYAGQEIGADVNIDILLDQRIAWSKADRSLEKTMGEILNFRKIWIKPDSPFEIIITDNDRSIMAYKHGPLLAFFNFSDQDFKFKADGVEKVILGELNLTEEGQFILTAGKFGVVQ